MTFDKLNKSMTNKKKKKKTLLLERISEDYN